MSVYPPNYAVQIGPTAPIPSLVPNTIIVVNADDTHGSGGSNQSLADANTYCTLRSIPTAGTYNAGNISPAIRQVHFGTVENQCALSGLQNSSLDGYVSGSQKISTAATYNITPSGSSLLQLCYSEITFNNCLCVIFSTYTPTRVAFDTAPGSLTLPGIAAAASTTLTLESLTTSGITGVGLTLGNTYALLEANIIPSNWSTITNLRPHGRLGCPDLTLAGQTFAELPLRAGGTTVFANAVANSMPRESTNNSELPVHYSSVDNNFNANGCAGAYTQYITGQGFATVTDMKSQKITGDLAYDFLYTNPMSPQQTLWCALWLEGLNVDSTGADYGIYAYNDAGEGSGKLGFQNNCSLEAGAFGGCWFSYSYNWGMNMLYNGASAMVMSVQEPYASNIAYGSEIFHYLVNQRAPIALANFYSPTYEESQYNAAVLGTTVFGDPLYAPFASTFSPSYGLGKGLIGGLKIGVS